MPVDRLLQVLVSSRKTPFVPTPPSAYFDVPRHTNLVVSLYGELSAHLKGIKGCRIALKKSSTTLPLQPLNRTSHNFTFPKMQFFKSAVVAVMAFAAVVVASPGGSPPPPCKPLLQSCSVNSECCGDLCVAGVNYFHSSNQLTQANMIMLQLCA